ncbi:hypothetical protein UA75_27885 [Actinoalloteichus sp. GBA129-24]|uniref:Uncharacterized protein n=1 Tax=Actinoalloteichus fjordicus TaxID=1612552 RepID=A0AAC9LHJ8_9PSEU|nr:hypothetical protein UA74_27340 [Actinoalloteichus fjordicus]APU23548.1 hypothetical protein UA75_27885 [Actinoalloteichus sp. GBA129-24]
MALTLSIPGLLGPVMLVATGWSAWCDPVSRRDACVPERLWTGGHGASCARLVRFVVTRRRVGGAL